MLLPLGLVQLDGHRKQNKIKLEVFNTEANCGEICSQRHKVIEACKTLGYISSFKLFFFLLLLGGSFFFFNYSCTAGNFKVLEGLESHQITQKF